MKTQKNTIFKKKQKYIFNVSTKSFVLCQKFDSNSYAVDFMSQSMSNTHKRSRSPISTKTLRRRRRRQAKKAKHQAAALSATTIKTADSLPTPLVIREQTLRCLNPIEHDNFDYFLPFQFVTPEIDDLRALYLPSSKQKMFDWLGSSNSNSNIFEFATKTLENEVVKSALKTYSKWYKKQSVDRIKHLPTSLAFVTGSSNLLPIHLLMIGEDQDYSLLSYEEKEERTVKMLQLFLNEDKRLANTMCGFTDSKERCTPEDTPLTLALKFQSPKVVHCLLEAKANLSYSTILSDKQKATLFQAVMHKESKEESHALFCAMFTALSKNPLLHLEQKPFRCGFQEAMDFCLQVDESNSSFYKFRFVSSRAKPQVEIWNKDQLEARYKSLAPEDWCLASPAGHTLFDRACKYHMVDVVSFCLSSYSLWAKKNYTPSNQLAKRYKGVNKSGDILTHVLKQDTKIATPNLCASNSQTKSWLPIYSLLTSYSSCNFHDEVNIIKIINMLVEDDPRVINTRCFKYYDEYTEDTPLTLAAKHTTIPITMAVLAHGGGFHQLDIGNIGKDGLRTLVIACKALPAPVGFVLECK